MKGCEGHRSCREECEGAASSMTNCEVERSTRDMMRNEACEGHCSYKNACKEQPLDSFFLLQWFGGLFADDK